MGCNYYWSRKLIFSHLYFSDGHTSPPKRCTNLTIETFRILFLGSGACVGSLRTSYKNLDINTVPAEIVRKNTSVCQSIALFQTATCTMHIKYLSLGS